MYKEKILAYIDEFGAYGFDFDKENVSTHFIVTASIVNERDHKSVVESVENIRKKYFQSGEIKSSRVGNNHKRREIILKQILSLPIRFIVLVVDKTQIIETGGLSKSKSVFYKFLNEHLYHTLRNSYSHIDIIVDEMGGNEYQLSFRNYVERQTKAKQLSLFDESSFAIDNSKNNLLVQVSDFISGSLAYSYDLKKIKLADGHNYRNLIASKINMVKLFPMCFEEMLEDVKSLTDGEDDPVVMGICNRKANAILQELNGKEDESSKMQYLILNYLLFRFTNNLTRGYISTIELKNFLKANGYKMMADQTFRNKVIGKLRDKGAIIASCSKGYRIPKSKKDIENYINHDKCVILPMISRLKKCYEGVLTGSNGDIDLLREERNISFKNLLTAT